MKPTCKKVAFGASVAAIAVLLGGCQALGIGGSPMARAMTDPELAAEARSIGIEQLEAGRQALAEGHTADAIQAFMIAKSFPEQMPAAYNGLAVAYSRLGRADLTERFFLTAVALAPEEDRYRANLATFYSRNGLTKTAGPAMAMAPAENAAPIVEAAQVPAVAAAPEPVARLLAGGVSVQTPGRHLHRVSRGEVTIRSATASAPAARTATATRRAVIEVGGARPSAYPIRVTLAQPKPAAQSYPIRIPLTD